MALARFRLFSHSLQIELGRHNNLPINDRLCTRCDYNAVDDEEHFLIHSSFFNEERDVLFHEVNSYNKNFTTLSSNFKFVLLLNCQEHRITKLLAKHVCLCLNKKNSFTHYRFVFVFTTLFVHYITLIFLSYVSSPYSFIFDFLMHLV